MLTVPEAARRMGRDPETVRRWLRSGRLRSKKIGTQYFIEEADLDAMEGEDHEELPVPPYLQQAPNGSAIPNVVRWVHSSRQGH